MPSILNIPVAGMLIEGKLNLMLAKPIRAVYESGQLRLLEPVELTEGQTVNVIIMPEESNDTVDLSQPRIAGLHAGEIWTSDDFDDLHSGM